MMQLSQSAFPNLQSRSPILQKIGNIENLRIVNDAKVDLLSGDDDVNPGWWSSLTYPSNLNCNTTLAGLVTGIRTNLCVASSRESYFLYCNSGKLHLSHISAPISNICFTCLSQRDVDYLPKHGMQSS